MDELLQGTTPLLNRVIFDYSLPVGVIVTFARLLALSWRSGYRFTEWMDFNGQLAPLLGLKKTQLREHLRWLQVARLVNWTIDANHRYRIFILPAGIPVSAIADRVGGGVDSQLLNSIQETHHHPPTGAGNPAEYSNGYPAGFPVEGAGAAPAGVGSAQLAGSAGAEAVTAEWGAAQSAGSGGAEMSLLAGQAGRPVSLSQVDVGFTPIETMGTSAFSAAPAPGGSPPGGGTPSGVTSKLSQAGIPAGKVEAQPARLSPLLEELWSLQGEPAFVETMSWLSRVGVWTDHALQIARQIAANEAQGSEYLPTRGDVLGWMAYCFAYKRKNEIDKPVQALAANLRANRRCPQELRPPRFCRVCGFAEGWCQCPGEGDYVYPPDFVGMALQTDGALYRSIWWGGCPNCHNLTCQCWNDEDEDEDEEWEDEDEDG